MQKFRFIYFAMKRKMVEIFHKARVRKAQATQYSPCSGVDIIIPVYKGLDETKACINSVLGSHNRTSHRVIVINDYSPEPELTTWLRNAAENKAFTLLENEQNIGFVKTVNRGMRYSSKSDVLLLNSDTEVANNWLDRLVDAAYQDTNGKPAGTVTPFSNNATICSYPRFCEDNDLPYDYDLPSLDQIFAETHSAKTIEIPTAIGFCMYIRRDCLNQVGFFDEVHFGRGYGEENDFCMRAIANGWKNIQALDTFIWHKGSVSFGIDQQPLHVQKASEVIDRLHSNYHSLIQQFVTKDPAGVYRTEVDLKRIQNSANPTVLMISHQLGGGTEHHCRELIRLYPEVNWLIIMPEVNGHVILQNSWAKGAVALRYHLLSEWDDLVLLLKALNVTRIHWHHRLGFPSEICNLAESLEVPQDVTLHDFYSICPQISLLGVDGCYCGEKGESQCMICLQKNSVAYSDNISKWRSQNYDWLRKCERIITPSYDSKNRIQHYFPDLEILSIPHPEKRQFHEAIWVKPANDEKLRVAVIGALSFEKGAVILEKTALLVDKKRLQISFKLFGYAYRALFDSCCLQVTGPYKEKDLPDMLAEWKPHIVWFPTQIPETYSYTLSTSMALGLPVVCTDIGAQAERLKGRQFSWLMPLNTTPEQWCSWFDAVREQEGVPEAGGSVKRKRVSPYFTQDEMSFYNRFYVVRNQKVLISTLPETWQSHSLGQDKPVSYRNHLISFLYWLRRQMLFRSITSKIPPTVQRRVKSFLLGER